MWKGLLALGLLSGFAEQADAALISPGELLEYSGTATWTIEMTVDGYDAGTAAKADALQVGHKATIPLSLGYDAYVDDRPVDQGGVGYTSFLYFFENGWTAASDIPSDFFDTTCGLFLNYCTGDLAGPGYQVVDSEYELSFGLVGEGADPALGDPVSLFISETVILQSLTDPNDWHYFTAQGRSVSGYDQPNISLIPLPAAAPLLAAGIGILLGVGRLRRRGRG